MGRNHTFISYSAGINCKFYPELLIIPVLSLTNLIKAKEELLDTIGTITLELYTRYTEPYRFINESPETIPDEAYPWIEIQKLTSNWTEWVRLTEQQNNSSVIQKNLLWAKSQLPTD